MALPPFEVKVVGVGLGRTGTNSLAESLNLLGIRTTHSPGPTTRDELRSGSKHLAALRDYQGIANGTGAPYRRIDCQYPGAKFILTVRRDEEAWLESKRRYAALELEHWSSYDEARRAAKQLIREEVYGSFEFDPVVWLESYRRHNRAVLEYFARRPEKLLVMDIGSGQGWELLCPFIGAPIPSIGFPHANSFESAAAWQERVARLWADLDACVGRESPFVLVDDCALGPDPRGHSLPFLERDGVYWGRPADDATAIAELERMRASGAALVVFIWSAFWWLDHYRELHRYLVGHYACILRNDRVAVFDLRGEARDKS